MKSDIYRFTSRMSRIIYLKCPDKIYLMHIVRVVNTNDKFQ